MLCVSGTHVDWIAPQTAWALASEPADQPALPLAPGNRIDVGLGRRVIAGLGNHSTAGLKWVWHDANACEASCRTRGIEEKQEQATHHVLPTVLIGGIDED
jgi:hypothetical protein